jgi:hypothetical protein
MLTSRLRSLGGDVHSASIYQFVFYHSRHLSLSHALTRNHLVVGLEGHIQVLSKFSIILFLNFVDSFARNLSLKLRPIL